MCLRQPSPADSVKFVKAVFPWTPGLWVEGRKLASIGIRLRHGLSFHGLALNLSPDLTPFFWICPCSMDIAMTSGERELGTAPSMAEVKKGLVESFLALCPCHKKGDLQQTPARVKGGLTTAVLP